MTDAAFILRVLEDGRKHSQADLLRRSFLERNCGLTVHSRIADLRKKGHYIVCERVPGADRGHAWTYQLVGSLPDETDQSLASPLDHGDHTADGKHDRKDEGRLVSSESEQLFTYPRSPEWA